MDCKTFDILGPPQKLHYDFWWNLPRDYMVTSEWALPPQLENGIVPEDLLSNKYGHPVHFWDLRAGATCRPSCRGAGSISTPLGPLVSLWWAHSLSRSAFR